MVTTLVRKDLILHGTSLGLFAVSPDGKTPAIAWVPEYDQELTNDPEPDPRISAWPRVTLIDLEENDPPRILIAPHGWAISLAFSSDGKLLAFGGAGAVHLFDLKKEP